MVNITKQTEDYIATHPLIKDCLKRGLINYSALTRLICTELKLDVSSNFDAVLIACRRYFSKVKQEPTTEKQILSILKQSKIEIKNKIAVFVLEKDIAMPSLLTIQKDAKRVMETFHIIEGATAITLIVAEEFIDKIKKTFSSKIIKKSSDLVEIVVKSPKQIETTAGVISYLYSLLGENGINVVETLSCWTDTIFLIAEKDLGKAMELLRF